MTVASVATTVDPRSHLRTVREPGKVLRYEPFGGARDFFFCLDREVLLDGPAGTGKSIACLKRLDRNAIKYPGSRQLILRKTRTSLTQSALITFEKEVIVPGGRVRFHTGQQAYLYPNGSVIVVGGLDKDSKVMSSEYDTIYVQEATELAEAEWEALTTRLRYGVIPHQQLIGDCNPNTPTHWLNKRCDDGKVTRILSRHEDNPRLWDGGTRAWTAYGTEYMARLEALSGVRFLRLRMGQWAAAEGLVYEGWDRNVHLVDAFALPEEWPRYLSIDFGYTNPFVCLWAAVDPDGRCYVYRELYQTQRLVTDHARQILALSANEPRPRAVITDHDAEDRATFERETRYRTLAARKEVSPGIQAVAHRLRPAGDGKPRLMIFRDARVVVDASLKESGKPTCAAEEFESYIWDTRQGQRTGEAPVKADDHGVDAIRYLIAHLDPWTRSKKVMGF